MLSDHQRQTLLQVARQALSAACADTPPPVVTTADPALTARLGVFVTLTKKGRLRGCIGYLEGPGPLLETVAEMAVAAAQNDPRFPAVTAAEVEQLQIEISVLSPLQPLASPEALQVGRHGLVVTRGSQRGVLLPQVAMEYGWSNAEFLSQTCLKAGLPPTACRETETQVEVFEAEVFHEADQ